MNTERIVESEVLSFMDCFYGYLLKEGMIDQMPESLKALFPENIPPEDIAFILDGVEDKYFDDHTYFRSEQYENKVYWAVAYGEIEIGIESIDKESIDDFCISGDYGYMSIPAIAIVYDIDKVKSAIRIYMA